MKRITLSAAIAAVMALTTGSAMAAQDVADGQKVQEAQSATQDNMIVQPPPIIYLPPAAPDRGQQMRQVQGEVMPLTPGEIRGFRRDVEAREAAVLDHKAPKLNSRTLSIGAGAEGGIPSVAIAPHYVATLVIVDSYGNPWPITGITNGSTTSFRASVPEVDPHNVVTIEALQRFGNSNLSLLLQGRSVPLIVQMKINQDAMDIRTDLVVAGAGPKTDLSSVQDVSLVSTTPNETMMAFVDGVPPEGAVEVTASDTRFRVWEYGGELYVRTMASVKTPRPKAVSNGPGGVRVYRMSKSPVVLFSANGKVQTLKLTLNVIGGHR